MKKTAGYLITLIVIALAYFVGYMNAQLPHKIYQAPADDSNLIQWNKDWREAGDSIVSATVISSSASEIYVYVDYIYSGSHGDMVSTCGSVATDGIRGAWFCSPIGIYKGRGFVTLNLGASSDLRDVECSNEIQVNFYQGKGSSFFTKTIPLKKTWIKNAEGFSGVISEIFSRCP